MRWLFGVLAGATVAWAGGDLPNPGPPTVSRVIIEGAPVAFLLETKAGEPLDETKLQHDVKALWAARRPSDVRVEELPDGSAAPSQNKSVALIFHVEERRTVTLGKVTIDQPTPGIKAGVEPGQQTTRPFRFCGC